MGLDMNLITTEARSAQSGMRFLFFCNNPVLSMASVVQTPRATQWARRSDRKDAMKLQPPISKRNINHLSSKTHDAWPCLKFGASDLELFPARRTMLKRRGRPG
jgi:hypothetical protein